MFVKKLIRFISTLAICVVYSQNCLAEVYRAGAISSIDRWEGSENVLFQNGTSSALTVATIDDLFGIYQLDFISKTLSLLLQIPAPEPFGCGYFVAPQFHNSGNKTFIDVLGKLYVTDGTPVGSGFIGDFGQDVFAGTGCINGSNIEAFYTIQNDLYFRLFQNNFPHNEDELWTSDGTVAGTKLIHRSNRLGDLYEIVGRIYFLKELDLENTALIRIKREAGEITLVPIKTFSRLPLNNIIQTSKGLFYCGGFTEPSVRSSNLFRMSNSFDLDAVGLGCDFSQALFTENDLVYFEGELTLWKSHGIRGDQKPVFTIEESRNLGNACFTQGSLFFSTFKLSNFTLDRSYEYSNSKGVIPILGIGSEIQKCFDSSLFIQKTSANEDGSNTRKNSIYSIASRQETKLREETDTFIYNSSIIEYKDQFFALRGRRIDGQSRLDVEIVKIFKSDFYPFLPALNLILDKD